MSWAGALQGRKLSLVWGAGSVVWALLLVVVGGTSFVDLLLRHKRW